MLQPYGHLILWYRSSISCAHAPKNYVFSFLKTTYLIIISSYEILAASCVYTPQLMVILSAYHALMLQKWSIRSPKEHAFKYHLVIWDLSCISCSNLMVIWSSEILAAFYALVLRKLRIPILKNTKTKYLGRWDLSCISWAHAPKYLVISSYEILLFLLSSHHLRF